MPLFIDWPLNEIDTLDPVIAGWVAGEPETPIRVLADNKPLAHFFADRPDVRTAHGGLPFATGIGAAIDLLNINRASFPIVIEYGQERQVHDVKITARILGEIARERALRQDAQNWCFRHIICPHCHAGVNLPKRKGDKMLCGACGGAFPMFDGKLDFLPDHMRFALHPQPDTTSANPYDPAALALIDRVTQAGGMVLDCGAGFRKTRTPHVINMEIVNYRSTDVLAVGEKLPFKDASFDAILSLAVLEHVRDPFACAREMLRVVKPGGQIMCSVPFMQPEHNFPGHFYNMTQSGLTNLFAGRADVIHTEVPAHGHPIFAVHWLLNDYLAGLPAPIRENFGKMTLAEAAALDPAAFLADPAATQLSPEAAKAIACLNTIVFQRPA